MLSGQPGATLGYLLCCRISDGQVWIPQMAAEPITKPGRVRAPQLQAFEPRYADLVVSWVCGAREAYWLAPRTKPPLTAAKVLAWAGAGRTPLMLVSPEHPRPLAYGEVNVLNHGRCEYWLGHVIVDPRKRGRGLGRRLTEQLLLRAFRRYGARCVSLVVFPENETALACYRTAGMQEDGFETHYFPSYRRHERLRRLIARSAPHWPEARGSDAAEARLRLRHFPN